MNAPDNRLTDTIKCTQLLPEVLLNDNHEYNQLIMTTSSDVITLLNAFSFDRQVLPSLPPDVRDNLLAVLQIWGTAQEQMVLLDILREAHGPLLLLLDYQVGALQKLGEYTKALELVERRQRRSSSITSQATEAMLHVGLGHLAHACTIADELVRSASRNALAATTAARVYAENGQYERAQTLLEQYLTQHPSDLLTTLTLSQLAAQFGERTRATEYLQRLGGIPSDMDESGLQELAKLYTKLGNQQSSNAVEVELARRKRNAMEKLQAQLAPFLASATGEFSDPEEFYRKLHGPESVHVTAEEQRRIQLEAVRHFGFMRLRTGQSETIAVIKRGQSLLTVMPTGAGKSLCYQLPALTFERSTLVISPLIALMKDQVEGLPAAARGKATFINSTLSDEELLKRMNNLTRGEYKLIYAAPERLRQREFLRAIRSHGQDLLVIDEATFERMRAQEFSPESWP